MKIKKALSAGIASLGMVVGLTGGFAAAMPGFNNRPSHHEDAGSTLAVTKTEVEVKNENDIEFKNITKQFAMSGEVEVEDNTTAEDTWSGDVENGAELGAMVEISNVESSTAALAHVEVDDDMIDARNFQNDDDHDGGDVKVIHTTEVEVENDNEIDVMNCVNQTAISGDVEVTDNTTAGSAISGDATNTSTVTMEFRIAN